MAFEKDLGYLDKFFEKIEAHGRTMGGDAGARLVALMKEDRARWAEVKTLLAGETPKAGPSPTPAKPDAKADTKPDAKADTKPEPKPDTHRGPDAPSPGANDDGGERPALTVGSLRGGAKG